MVVSVAGLERGRHVTTRYRLVAFMPGRVTPAVETRKMLLSQLLACGDALVWPRA